MKRSATNYKLRGQLGKNTSTEGGMMETPLSPENIIYGLLAKTNEVS